MAGRKWLLIIASVAFVLLLVLSFIRCRHGARGRSGRESSPTSEIPAQAPAVAPTAAVPGALPASRPAAVANPFGVMVSGASAQMKADRARQLGVRYIRPLSIFTGNWNGRDEECEAARAAGLELILTVRTGSGPRQPSGPPADLNEYQRIVGEILDRYHPALLVVENEENSAQLFYTGTPEEYHRELAAAAEVAHARGIKVTNGGLVSDLIAALVADEMAARGENDRADRYLQATLGERNVARLTGSTRLREQLARGKALLAGYRTAGADYANFHWYNDAAEFAAAVAYVKSATGLPVISNELGQQRSTAPATVSALMAKALELELPVAIWFSIDISSHAQARGLFDDDGALRDNGKAFRDFIRTRCGG